MTKFLARYPLRQRAVLIGVLLVVVQVLTKLGVHAGGFETIANGAITILGLLGVVTSTEPLVTPVADPRGVDGQPLVRLDQAVGMAQLAAKESAPMPARTRKATKSTRRRTT